MKRIVCHFIAGLMVALLVGGCAKKPTGPDYSGASELSIVLAEKPVDKGLSLAEPNNDTALVLKKIAGQDCATIQSKSGEDDYIAFKIAPSFKKELAMNLKVTVEYYDIERGSFWIDYDGWAPHNDKEGAYIASEQKTKLTGNPTVWLKATFILPKARLRNRQSDGGDFRIHAGRAQMYIHAVTVERVELKE
jgi:hypothetical protein